MSVLYGMDSFLNKVNGDLTESMMSKYFKGSGWGQTNGEIGVNGIDGLFIKKDKDGNVKSILAVESKYNTGALRMNKNNTRQMSKKALLKQIDTLKKDITTKISKTTSEAEKAKLKKALKQYQQIKNKIWKNDYRARIFKIKPTGVKDEFKITIDAIEQKGFKDVSIKKLKGSSKYKAHEVKIKLSKNYPKGSYEAKLQKQLKDSIRKERRLLKEKNNLKRFIKNQKNFKKDSKRYKLYDIAISKQKKFIEKIKKSRSSFLKTTNKIKQTKKVKNVASVKKFIPATMIKKGKKVLVFMDAKVFKNANKFKKLKFLKNVKGGDVVILALESGVAVYTILKGGMTYKKVASLLVNNSKGLAGSAFSKCACFIAPPTGIVIAIAGTILIDYAIDKYIELDKRNYIKMEDLFWDVPNEVKKRITVLNLEDTTKETVFDFGDIDKDTILDEDVKGESILNDESSKKTILDY